MEIKIQSVNFDADNGLQDFVNDKVAKLEVFYDRIVGADVFLLVDKPNARENKVAEIKLNLAGKELFAKKQCDSFEEAVDAATEALRKQIIKHKEKAIA